MGVKRHPDHKPSTSNPQNATAVVASCCRLKNPSPKGPPPENPSPKGPLHRCPLAAPTSRRTTAVTTGALLLRNGGQDLTCIRIRGFHTPRDGSLHSAASLPF